MNPLLLSIIFLLLLIISLIVLSCIWTFDSPWAPWWRTSKDKARAVCRLAKVTRNDVVYELGSGEGNTLIVAAKEFGAKGIGIEIDPLRWFISMVIIHVIKMNKRVVIKRENLFDVDLSDATVVYFYLIPKTLTKLKPKLLKELRPGTRIVSLCYEIDLPLVVYDKKNNLRLYLIL